MRMRAFAAILAVALGTTAVGLAAAPPPGKAALNAVAARQAQMKRLRGATKAISGYLQGAHDDVGQVRAAAATLQDVGARMPRLFPRGTAVGVGTSRAKPAIWTEQAAVRRRIAGFRAASAAFASAAAAGDKARIGQQFRAVGATCKGCHDPYQAPPL
ncbi:MAG TPA: cytochrome c [Allosphingosinicella sp.]